VPKASDLLVADLENAAVDHIFLNPSAVVHARVLPFRILQVLLSSTIDRLGFRRALAM
jgi:hypothetical protein